MIFFVKLQIKYNTEMTPLLKYVIALITFNEEIALCESCFKSAFVSLLTSFSWVSWGPMTGFSAAC